MAGDAGFWPNGALSLLVALSATYLRYNMDCTYILDSGNQRVDYYQRILGLETRTRACWFSEVDSTSVDGRKRSNKHSSWLVSDSTRTIPPDLLRTLADTNVISISDVTLRPVIHIFDGVYPTEAEHGVGLMRAQATATYRYGGAAVSRQVTVERFFQLFEEGDTWEFRAERTPWRSSSTDPS